MMRERVLTMLAVLGVTLSSMPGCLGWCKTVEEFTVAGICFHEVDT